MSEILQRALVTAWVLGMAWAGTWVALPGVTLPPAYAESVATLGATPLVSGFLLVELVAFAVPAWRPLVRGGPAERVRLWRASVAVAVGVAAFLGFTLALMLEEMPGVVASPGGGFRATIAGMLALASSGSPPARASWTNTGSGPGSPP